MPPFAPLNREVQHITEEEVVGAVAITGELLCYEEEGQTQKEQEQDIALARQSQGYWYCDRTRLIKTILSPILERQVTFAAQVIRDASGDGRIISVVDDVRISSILHVNEYSKEEKHNMWYSRKEMSSMRRRCVNAVRTISKHTELYCPHFFRGLEGFLDQVISFTNNSTCGSRRWDAMVAVFKEQQEQRHHYAQTYGTLYGAMMDPEKLRHAYTKEGNTGRSQSIAYNLAKEDEIQAKEYLNEFEDKQEIEYEDDDYDDDEQGRHNKYVLSNATRSILYHMLAPIFEIRHGDIYLEIGDACF